MREKKRNDEGEHTAADANIPKPGVFPADPAGMTLEDIIDLTGELGHLNDLVMLHLERNGGFTSMDSYFCAVQPLLDLLEVEIRIRFREKMSTQDMKLIIQDWIDNEIADLKKNVSSITSSR